MAGPRVLIVVPARGGSKGLPRKNIRLLAGRPLLAWTAEAIRAAALPDALAILSTDDDEIAAVGRDAGLVVPFRRPRELATDEASAEAVALHALLWAEREHGGTPEAVMLLQPTSPFRPATAIAEADAMLRADPAAQGVLGVKPVYRSLSTLFRMDLSGRLSSLAPHEGGASRRQALEPLYTANGAMYLVRTEVLRRDATLFPPVCRALVMDAIASLDIDDEADWAIAQAVAERR